MSTTTATPPRVHATAPRTHTIGDIHITHTVPNTGPALTPWQRVAWVIILASMAGLVASFCHRVEDLPGTALVRADALEHSTEDTQR